MSMIEAVYREHYSAIRKKLMGTPTKVTPKKKEELDVKSDNWWRLDQERRCKKQQELEQRKAEAIQRAIEKFGHVINQEKQIIRDVAKKHGLTYSDLIGQSRAQKVVTARHEAIHAVKRAYPNKSLPKLGRLFGGRDHSTILHALRKPCTGTYYNKQKQEELKPDWALLAGEF